MFFAALIMSLLLGRMFRGCLKYALLAAFLVWLSRTDPVLSHRIWDLLERGWEELREFILSL
jgi:hypothetical protein